jgi:hypothetical protein
VPVSYYFLSLNQSYKLSGLLTYTHVVKDKKSNLSLAEVDQPCDPLLTSLFTGIFLLQNDTVI